MMLILSAVNWIQKIALRIIRKKAAKLNRTVNFKNLEAVKNIGIIYDATSRNDDEQVKKLIRFFKEERKNVLAVGFVNTKRKEELPADTKDKIYFGKNDLNIWGLPKKNTAVLNRFNQSKFDLLINLNLSENNLPLTYLFAVNDAPFKIAVLNKLNEQYGDFFIDISSKPTLDYLIIQLKHYLSIINKKTTNYETV